MGLKNEDYVTVYRVWLIIVCSLLVLAENPGIIILVKWYIIILSYHLLHVAITSYYWWSWFIGWYNSPVQLCSWVQFCSRCNGGWLLCKQYCYKSTKYCRRFHHYSEYYNVNINIKSNNNWQYNNDTKVQCRGLKSVGLNTFPCSI